MRETIKVLAEKHRKIHAILCKHPEQAHLVRHYINYYLSRTFLFVDTYLRIAEYDDDENLRRKEKIAECLASFVSAYDAALATLTREDLSDIDAELDVARKMLKADGLGASKE